MNANPQIIWIALVGIAVLIVILAMAAGLRRSRTTQLRRHYGNEYDRTVREVGSRTAAEQALVDRKEEVDKFRIRPLTAVERDRYLGEWKRVEERFVDRPKMAVGEADELITAVMRARGYPMVDFQQHIEHLSVRHPRVIEHYRAGHAVIEASATASTEDLRQAMLHYRTLFEDLVSEGADIPRVVRSDREIAEPARITEIAEPTRVATRAQDADRPQN